MWSPAAPAVGAIVLAVLTAQELSEGDNEVATVWADETADSGFLFDRAGFDERLRGRRVLVVEDLVTTGGSVQKVCREVERHGATIVAASAICNRGAATAEGLSVPRSHTVGTGFRELSARGLPAVRRLEGNRGGHGAWCPVPQGVPAVPWRLLPAA